MGNQQQRMCRHNDLCSCLNEERKRVTERSVSEEINMILAIAKERVLKKERAAEKEAAAKEEAEKEAAAKEAAAKKAAAKLKHPYYCCLTTPPQFKEEREGVSVIESGGYPFVVCEGKNIGGKLHKNDKFESWDKIIELITESSIQIINLSSPNIKNLFLPEDKKIDYMYNEKTFNDSVRLIQRFTRKVLINKVKKRNEKIQKKIYYDFLEKALLGTCKTRKVIHWISFDLGGITYILEKAMKEAGKGSKSVKLIIPNIVPILPQDVNLNGTEVDHSIEITCKCCKDEDSYKECKKHYSLNIIAFNLQVIVELFIEKQEKLTLAYRKIEPFKLIIEHIKKICGMISEKILEIANLIDPMVVTCCPQDQCPENFFIKPLIIRRVNINGSLENQYCREKGTYCPKCIFYFCSECGIELNPEEEALRPHVCDQRSKFKKLSKEDQDLLLSKLGSQYQFCCRCNALQEWSGGCSKLSCHVCGTCFCLECGLELDGRNYLEEHLIILSNQVEIICRFKFVYNACRRISDEEIENMKPEEIERQTYLLRELVAAIENGNQQVLSDLERIADDQERYPVKIHELVKNVLLTNFWSQQVDKIIGILF